MNISILDKETYAGVDRWVDFFDKGKHLKNIPYEQTWYVLFEILMANPKFSKVNDKLKEAVQKNRQIKIYPHPSYLFAAFLATPLNFLKVVFIGQDPYFNCDQLNGKYVPQAHGLSFSVPHDIPVPSSLDNIYANLVKYNHIKEKPKSGNLWYWAYQGCLMLNASLTVEDGCKNSHAKLWDWLTNDVIKYISKNMSDVIFVLWGASAYAKIEFIDEAKHHTIISSHPSGLSAHKPFSNYPAFMNEDHFGKINTILEKKGQTRILWD
jgi:uracil-DNA glycosylase